METIENIETNVPNKLAELSKCAHGGCNCTVDSGQQYCSDYCASMANGDQAAGDHECACGHPECTASASLPNTATIGREVF
jgi:hypothetical protein